MDHGSVLSFIWKTTFLFTSWRIYVLAQGPHPPPPFLLPHPPGPPPPTHHPEEPPVQDIFDQRLQCDLGILRQTWFLGSRVFGLCMARNEFLEGSKLLMESRETDLLAWYGLAFDRFDRNKDGNLSLNEYMRGARNYYGRFYNIPIAELREFYTKYLSVNGTSSRAVVQKGTFRLEVEQIRGREWDRMNGDEGPCLRPEIYMSSVCETAVHNSRQVFHLLDTNGDNFVSRAEFHNSSIVLGLNSAAEEVHWRLLDTNKNGYIDRKESYMFTLATLRVL